MPAWLHGCVDRLRLAFPCSLARGLVCSMVRATQASIESIRDLKQKRRHAVPITGRSDISRHRAQHLLLARAVGCAPSGVPSGALRSSGTHTYVWTHRGISRRPRRDEPWVVHVDYPSGGGAPARGSQDFNRSDMDMAKLAVEDG